MFAFVVTGDVAVAAAVFVAVAVVVVEVVVAVVGGDGCARVFFQLLQSDADTWPTYFWFFFDRILAKRKAGKKDLFGFSLGKFKFAMRLFVSFGKRGVPVQILAYGNFFFEIFIPEHTGMLLYYWLELTRK